MGNSEDGSKKEKMGKKTENIEVKRMSKHKSP
jgi:hypothetical protein